MGVAHRWRYPRLRCEPGVFPCKYMPGSNQAQMFGQGVGKVCNTPLADLTPITPYETVNHMVNHIEEKLDDVFYALSDPTRREILGRLANGEATVKELASPFSMSLPAVSKHLKVLERAGLLIRQVDGRTHRMRLQPDGLKTASEWVDHYKRFWEAQLDRLSAFLDVANSRTAHSSDSVERLVEPPVEPNDNAEVTDE